MKRGLDMMFRGCGDGLLHGTLLFCGSFGTRLGPGRKVLVTRGEESRGSPHDEQTWLWGEWPKTVWSESRPTSNQAGDVGTSGSKVCGKAWIGHLKDSTQYYRRLGWLVWDFFLCTFTDFTLVHRLSPQFFE